MLKIQSLGGPLHTRRLLVLVLLLSLSLYTLYRTRTKSESFFIERLNGNLGVTVLYSYRTTESHVKNNLTLTTAIVASLAAQLMRTTETLNVGKTTENCIDSFAETLEENLNVVSKYPRGNADIYLQHVNGNLTQPITMMTSFPVIVSGADYRYYGVLQGLLQTIHDLILPKYKDIRMIVYDLGFTSQQRENVKTYCKCEVRTFPFHLFPPHVKKLTLYAWKPLIVKTVLMEFGWIWWMDSSTRFTTGNLDTALQYSKNNSILFYSNPTYWNTAYHTDLATWRYLKEDPCKYRELGEIEAGFNLYHFDTVTNITVNQWMACALNRDCIAPTGTENKLLCYPDRKFDGRCHRFDQSILSIILRRLFHETNDYPLKKIDIRTFRRGENVNYFEILQQRKDVN